jgi:hypothetical protein
LLHQLIRKVAYSKTDADDFWVGGFIFGFIGVIAAISLGIFAVLGHSEWYMSSIASESDATVYEFAVENSAALLQHGKENPIASIAALLGYTVVSLVIALLAYMASYSQSKVPLEEQNKAKESEMTPRGTAVGAFFFWIPQLAFLLLLLAFYVPYKILKFLILLPFKVIGAILIAPQEIAETIIDDNFEKARGTNKQESLESIKLKIRRELEEWGQEVRESSGRIHEKMMELQALIEQKENEDKSIEIPDEPKDLKILVKYPKGNYSKTIERRFCSCKWSTDSIACPGHDTLSINMRHTWPEEYVGIDIESLSQAFGPFNGPIRSLPPVKTS